MLTFICTPKSTALPFFDCRYILIAPPGKQFNCFLHAHKRTRHTHLCTHIYTQLCTHTPIYLGTWSTHKNMHIYVREHTDAHTQRHAHVLNGTCILIHMHMYWMEHAHTHTHTNCAPPCLPSVSFNPQRFATAYMVGDSSFAECLDFKEEPSKIHLIPRVRWAMRTTHAAFVSLCLIAWQLECWSFAEVTKVDMLRLASPP